MLVRPADVAVKILRDTYSQVKDKLDSRQHDSTVLAETVRIISLSRVLNSWISSSADRKENSLLRTLSPTGFRNLVDPELVQSLVTDLISQMKNHSELANIPRLSPLGMTDVLGNIHSIGSHTLSPRGFSVKRLHGAFYTPSEVACFISRRVVAPVLHDLWTNSNEDEEFFSEQLEQLTILDPCCGPGVFLVSTLEVIQTTARELGIDTPLPLTKLLNNLYGVDIDSAALEIARLCLDIAAGVPLEKASKSKNSKRLFTGNSIINLNGHDGSNHGHFFKTTSSRQPFEWESSFASVFRKGGFDFVLFNPPYERLKPNLAEFMRESLRAGHALIKLKEYESYKTLLMEDLDYYRNSGVFYLSISSTMNTYQLFIERALQVSKEGGRIGFVVPSTLLGDFSSRNLRKHLLFENSIKSISEFTESAKLFPGVTQSVCIAVIEKGGKSNSFSVQHGLESIADAASSSGYQITTKGIGEVFGNSLSIPRVEAKDWKILQKMHSHSPVSSYRWLLNHRGELDLTMDKHHIISGTGTIPLIRGRDIGRYSLLPLHGKRNSEFVDLNSFKKARNHSRRIKHVEYPRIACQQVSNLRNRWRLKFSKISSDAVLANSCNYLSVDPEMPSYVLDYLLGVMNSELLNWRFYVSSTNNHVSNRELGSLPLVNPFDIQHQETTKAIVSRVKKIKKHTDKINPEIEALVCGVYGLTPSSVRRIMKTRGLSRAEIHAILEEWNSY